MFNLLKMTTVNPCFEIKINGQPLDKDLLLCVDSIEFQEEINTVSTFSISFMLSRTESKQWKYFESDTFSLGGEMELSIGMEKPSLLMSGEIVALDPKFSLEFCRLDIRVFNRLHRLRFGTKTRTFLKTKDCTMAQTIAGDWGLSYATSKSDTTETNFPQIFQNNQSDFDFLMDRAKALRFEVGVEGKDLFFRKSKEKETSSLELSFPKDILDFSASLNTRHQGNKVQVRGWDTKQKKSIEVNANAGKNTMNVDKTGIQLTKKGFSIDSFTTVTEKNIVDLGHAKTLAESQFEMELADSVTAEGSCSGNEKIRSGKTAKIIGIGKFSGMYYITSTRHTIANKMYTTSFSCRRTGI